MSEIQTIKIIASSVIIGLIMTLFVNAGAVLKLKSKLNVRELEIATQDEIIDSLIDEIANENNYSLTLTAYSLTKDQCNEDLENTALMQKPIPGYTAAVSRDLLHLLNRKVYIDGYGVFLINDLMNKRFENRIDILVGNRELAMEIGKNNDTQIVILN